MYRIMSKQPAKIKIEYQDGTATEIETKDFVIFHRLVENRIGMASSCGHMFALQLSENMDKLMENFLVKTAAYGLVNHWNENKSDCTCQLCQIRREEHETH